MSARVVIVRCPLRSPRTMIHLRRSFDPAHDVLSVVGDDEVGAGALDAGDGLHDGALLVQPPVGRRFLDHRVLAAHGVGGEYAMIRAAAANGWLDEERAVMEAVTGIKRAGADPVSYTHLRAHETGR